MLVYILCVVICLVTDTEQSQWSDWQMRRSRAVNGDFGAGTHTVPCHSSIIFYYPTQPNHHTTLALHWLFYDDWVSRCTGLFETQIFTKPQWKWPYINQPHTHSFLSLMWNAVKETHKPCPQLHSLTWKPRWELSWQEAHTNLRQAKALFRHALRGESLYLCPSWKSSHPVPSAGWISNDLLAGQDGREMWSSGGGTPTSLAHIPPSVLL